MQRRALIAACTAALVLVTLASFHAAAGSNPEEILNRADRGDSLAQLQLGSLYAEGDGVAQDDSLAASWYRKAAAQGEALAQYNLGVVYAEGRGVVQDYAEAQRWYCLAAEQGDAGAQYALGALYAAGWGVPLEQRERFREAARWWWRRAAAQGHAEARRRLDEPTQAPDPAVAAFSGLQR